ncbi:hypothetical protein F2Q65_03145 [Thiohalocapsa marina]|uniref:ATP-grasp domain-containing protein n=1 Tax=Thiohalocapsa marina TaxID=424902 RepID=A0A5M8FQL3_9GAMM|nr:hypothetical protein [Thiohalocapsa marina]KAA6186904.1 hypothetical protein F2Q65_03145 [Thiohalocapsa marina]
MPFIGILPGREHLFRPQPVAEVPVSDAAAWRLCPQHRRVYDKLSLALDAGLTAAPCGVDPAAYGIAADTELFVKPVVNLSGMGLAARRVRADAIPEEPGSFWCECLHGTHTSSDCLVRDGEVRWFAHTRASAAKDAERPLYWEVGAALPELEADIRRWVARWLPGYTGLCNIELIGGRPIEAHLRGSNGFFDLYGPHFMPAWVALMDGTPFQVPPAIPGGYVISVFGRARLAPDTLAAATAGGCRVQPDPATPGRAAILRCRTLATGAEAYQRLTGRSLPLPDAAGDSLGH